MQDQKLRLSIDEGVSKGVPMDYIAYSLKRGGWPSQMVDEAINTWLLENGRSQKTTAFSDWLKKYYRQAAPAILLMVVLSTLVSAIALLKPWPIKILADSVFGSITAPGPLAPYTHKPTLILIVSFITLVLFLLGSIFGFIKDYALLKIGFWLSRYIKEESFRHILHLPLYHEGRLSKGDYIYRQNDVTNSLSDLVLNSTSQIIESSILVVGVLVIMLKLNLKLTLITLIVIPFLVISIRIFGPIMGKLGRLLAELASKTAALIAESIDNTESVQAFTLQDRQVNKLKDLWDQNYVIAKRGLIWGKLFNFSNGLTVVLGTSAVIYFGGIQALNHEFSLGTLLIFMTYMGYLIGPIQSITAQITVRRQKLVDVGRVYEMLNDHEGIEHLREEKVLDRPKGKIEFQNVTYAHKDNLILNHIDFTIEPGQKIGIIGPSGSGKSTLLRLLDLYLEPTAGRILIDGIDIQNVSLHDLRRSIAWVSQSPQLFSSTIAENMCDGDTDRIITAQEIEQAMQAANMNEFIEKLPLGLDSIAGEDGSNLSGGQKQRISIARALLKNAPIVCLDEPTSALDAKSERLLVNSINELINNKTVLLVTHRMPLLSLMDKIYVLDNGNLVGVEKYGGIEKYAHQLQINGEI